MQWTVSELSLDRRSTRVQPPLALDEALARQPEEANVLEAFCIVLVFLCVVTAGCLIAFLIIWRLYVSEAFERLKTEVTETRTVAASAVALIGGLAERLRELADAPTSEEIAALADELDAAQNDLASAITANTPASPGGEDTTTGTDTSAGGGGDTLGGGEGNDTIEGGEG